ncbi:hypothetical protein [Rothia koreensis]|uniref:hypothetical protein n=1 Tax=Rothia koreensis TaxID=592378 RepID=UPI003FCCEC6F
MKMPFATIDDLKNRWPDFPPGGQEWAQTILEDVSQFIVDVCPLAAQAPESTLRRITCAVARRGMLAGSSEMVGMKTAHVATGPFSASYSPVNPNGDFYLTKLELKALGGGGRPAAFGVSLGPEEPGIVRHRWCGPVTCLPCDCPEGG